MIKPAVLVLSHRRIGYWSYREGYCFKVTCFSILIFNFSISILTDSMYLILTFFEPCLPSACGVTLAQSITLPQHNSLPPTSSLNTAKAASGFPLPPEPAWWLPAPSLYPAPAAACFWGHPTTAGSGREGGRQHPSPTRGSASPSRCKLLK